MSAIEDDKWTFYPSERSDGELEWILEWPEKRAAWFWNYFRSSRRPTMTAYSSLGELMSAVEDALVRTANGPVPLPEWISHYASP